MKHLQVDSIGGASGDMLLGALVALGAPLEKIQSELEPLVHEPFEIRRIPCESHHLHGHRLEVILPPQEHHHPAHRTFAEIRDMIQNSALAPEVKDLSARVFQCLADAEGLMHGIPAEQVHFHEIGAVDSIVDIVGACLALCWLEIGGVSFGPLPQGRGLIHCDHGLYPNPAPATMEILTGLPVEQTDLPFELVTPTGAALLKTWKTATRAPSGSCPLKTVNSFGHHVLPDRPNLLRATLLETAGTPQEDECLVLECQVDDTTPELIGALTGRLLAAGALDVFTTAIQMKKQRPGVLLTVLCPPALKPILVDLIFQESTTFGIRERLTSRTILERRMETVETPYGRIPIKIGRWKGRDITRAPEMEACISAAQAHQVPARTVYEAAQAASRLISPKENA